MTGTAASDNGLLTLPDWAIPAPLWPSMPQTLPAPSSKATVPEVGRPANLVLTKTDFFKLCEFMHNGNPPDHFLRVWTDPKTGEAHFCKAKNKAADDITSWAWSSVAGEAKVPTGIGFYPNNPQKMSRWAAIDFDAHDGNAERARRLSSDALRLLLSIPNHYVILCASGNGYHLFVLRKDYLPVHDWILLLKNVCHKIGTQIAPSVCEIFPDENAEHRSVGRGIRAPGTLNPKNGGFSTIEVQNIGPLLQSIGSTWMGGVGKARSLMRGNGQQLSLHDSICNYSLSTKGLINKLITKYPIAQFGIRNTVLTSLVGDMIHKFGRKASEDILKLHYETYKANIRTNWEEHLKDFDSAWNGMVGQIVDGFSGEERESYDGLTTDHQREGFRTVRSFAGAAAYGNESAFPVARNSLADRLSLTPQGAGGIVQKLQEVGALILTCPYRPHTAAGRYSWVCNEPLPVEVSEAPDKHIRRVGDMEFLIR